MTIAFLPPNKRSSPDNIDPPETATARIAPLAVLPVFYKLEGKQVLLIGGSDAAAWKAELLAAAGAVVHVIATEFSPLFQAIIDKPTQRGGYQHFQRAWSLRDFEGKALAIADIEDDAQAKAFTCAARGAGVPYNVIDNPAFCQFQFGAIVNRSPVVISISTDGAAPILGQAIRRRIEILLPASLAEWGGFAQKIRKTVMATLKAGGQRRAFWEQLAQHAFTQPFSNSAAHGLVQQAATIASTQNLTKRMELGRVTWVGVSSGDAELLTIKAVRALQSADVIIYDERISAAVLEVARREAKRILVSNGGGLGQRCQKDMSAMVFNLASAGKHVVQLLSSGPAGFDNASEQIKIREAEGIPVSVVPVIRADFHQDVYTPGSVGTA